MRRVTPVFLGALLIPLLLGTRAAAVDSPPTPAEQFAALKKEYNTSTSAPGPLTDAERLQFVGGIYKHHFEVAVKLVQLAEAYPNDPIALDALIQAVQQVNNTPWPVSIVGEDRARPRAFELLRRDHFRSDRLGPLCERISYGFASEYEGFLRELAARSPHRDVQATACLSLARYLNNRLQRVDLCREQPQLAREFEELFGKDYLTKLLLQRRERAMREIETTFERATKYGDAKLPDGALVADRARSELLVAREIKVGREAPDIEAVDQDGKTFKLSDYRGKVVLLDFWSFV